MRVLRALPLLFVTMSWSSLQGAEQDGAGKAHGESAEKGEEKKTALDEVALRKARELLDSQFKKDQEVRQRGAKFYSDEVIENLRKVDPDAAIWLESERDTSRRDSTTPKTMQEHMVELRAVDAQTTRVLQEFVKEHGWPDTERFGKETAHNALIMIHHVHVRDGALFREALRSVERDVKAGREDKNNLKTLADDLPSVEAAERLQKTGKPIEPSSP